MHPKFDPTGSELMTFRLWPYISVTEMPALTIWLSVTFLSLQTFVAIKYWGIILDFRYSWRAYFWNSGQKPVYENKGNVSKFLQGSYSSVGPCDKKADSYKIWTMHNVSTYMYSKNKIHNAFNKLQYTMHSIFVFPCAYTCVWCILNIVLQS